MPIMPTDQPVMPHENPRRFHPAPVWLLVAVLAVEVGLFVSEPWLPKGWPVLIAVACLLAAMAMVLLWFVVALFFRWRFQFSLRSLLVLTVVVAATCSWMTVRMQQAEKQREVDESLCKLRGYVNYDYDFDSSGKQILPPKQPSPAWLRNLLGDDFFREVTHLRLCESKVTSVDLELIGSLKHLKELNLIATDITDGAGLKHLEALGELEELALGMTQVTDAGLKHLKGLKRLQKLYLEDNQITDSGLEYLKGLKRLQTLSLSGDKLTDTGLECLEGLGQLRSLSLAQTSVTDAGVTSLARLQQLQNLDLDSTHITDSGLEHLKGLKQLKTLKLARTRVTAAGVENLKKALPKVLIVHQTP
jgi:hypothetical protein